MLWVENTICVRATGIPPTADSADSKRKITGSRVRAGRVVKEKGPSLHQQSSNVWEGL